MSIEKYFQEIKRLRFAAMYLMGLSGILFTVSNFCVQMSIRSNVERIPTMELVLLRHITQLILLLPIVVTNYKLFYVSRKDFLDIFIMGSVGFLTTVLIFLSLDKIPIADTTFILFTSPVLTAVFSYMILKEKVHWVEIVCGFFSFLGVLIIARPTFLFGARKDKVNILFHGTEGDVKQKANIYTAGIGFAVMGTVFLSLYYVYTRKVGLKLSFLHTIFWPSLIGSIFSPVFLYLESSTFLVPNSDCICIMYMVLLGVSSTLGLFLMNIALKIENAGTVVLIRNMDILYAFILQGVCMSILPNLWSITGGTIIIASTSIIVLRKAHVFKRCHSDSLLLSKKYDDESREPLVVEKAETD